MSVESSEIRTTRHTIRLEAVGRLAEMLCEHNRRVAKLVKRFSVDVAPATFRTVSTSRVTDPRSCLGVEHLVTMAEVEVRAQTARIAGYEIVASVTRTDEGYMLSAVRGGMAGIDAKAVVARGSDCDHCGTRRKRAATYLLRDGEGKIQQVGSTCLADYTGSRSGRRSLAPSAWAAYADMLVALDRSMETVSDEGSGKGPARRPSAQPLVHYLSFVRAAIRQGGWLSRGKAFGTDGVATADIAWDALTDEKSGFKLHPTDDDRQGAAEDLELVTESISAKSEASDYEQNLMVVVNQGFAFRRNIGLAASVCAAADRVRADRARQPGNMQHMDVDEYMGTVGKSETFVLRCYHVQDLESEFGITHLHLFVDDRGRKAKWFASKVNLEQGTYEIFATVRRHEDYRGKKTTVLNYCNIVRKVEETV